MHEGMDLRAVDYGSRPCSPWLGRVAVYPHNIQKHIPVRTYDLVWSAGLYDYFPGGNVGDLG